MYTTATSGAVYNISNTVGTGFEALYKLDIPQGTGHVFIQMNSTSSGGYIYGKNYADGTYSGYNCYTSSETSVGNIYVYELFCFTPRAGDFYVTIQDDNMFSAVVQYTVLTCPAGMGGFNCTFPAVALNLTSLPLTVTVPYSSDGVQYLTYGWSYFYIDIPGNITNMGELQISASSTQSGYLNYRRNGFPEDSSTYGYEDSFEYDSYPSSYSINQFEWQVAGRIYFGLECTTTPSCAVTIGANSSITTGSSGVSTTGSGTGVSTTGTATGVSTTASTTAQASTTGSTTRAATTQALTTSRGVTTSAQEHSSPASTLIPSVLVGLVAYLLF